MTKAISVAVVGALIALIAGCSAPAPDPDAATTSAVSDCAGVSVVVDYASLDETAVAECVESSSAMTALAAFTAAGVELAPSEAYGDAIVCRVNGRPAADEALKTEKNGPYTESCAEFGPVWASWAVWVDTGSGWQLGQEAINTQMVQPGQAVSLVWEQGDYTDMAEWLKPAV